MFLSLCGFLKEGTERALGERGVGIYDGESFLKVGWAGCRQQW